MLYDWDGLWTSLIGTHELWGYDVSMWVSLLIVVIVVIFMHILYWVLYKPYVPPAEEEKHHIKDDGTKTEE